MDAVSHLKSTSVELQGKYSSIYVSLCLFVCLSMCSNQGFIQDFLLGVGNFLEQLMSNRWCTKYTLPGGLGSCAPRTF